MGQKSHLSPDHRAHPPPGKPRQAVSADFGSQTALPISIDAIDERIR